MLTTLETHLTTIQSLVPSQLVTSKRTLLIMCISMIIVFLILVYYMSSSNESPHLKIISHTMHMLGVNETIYFHRYLNMGITFEKDRDCNLATRSRCYVANKSLVVTFWREESRNKWLAKNILKVFPDEYFTRVIMVHDNSTWTSFSNREQLIWIHVNAQKRFWYLKRFLTPLVLKAYRYIWILDDDVELLFDPLHYECVIDRLNISFSAPGRMKGVASHVITRVNEAFIEKIGRWTDFVEIGPIFIGSSSAWECLWHYMSPFVGLGWGFDLVWCKLLAFRCSANSTVEHSCAILDIFTVNHLSEYIGSTAGGSQEIPAYNEYYGNYNTRQTNIGPLANDRTIYSTCKRN